MTATLDQTQFTRVRCAAELHAYSDCLRLECEDDDAPADDLRHHLARALKRISRTLMERVDDQ